MKTSHIQIIVKKIMALEPNLILVGNNVSKHALDLFLRVWLWSGSEVKLDVSVAVNCDAEMMKQISRMTGAKIVKHLDDVARTSLFVSADRLVLDPSDVIGSCGLFIARDFRTLIHRRRRTSLVEVIANCGRYGVGTRAKTSAIGGDLSVF